MLESLNTDIFEYKKLSPEEMQSRGILGRLVGVMADSKNPTRNGRHYSDKLWENVFQDPIMKERIDNNCCFGELGHPADREETDMEKIAICMDGFPKKDNNGKLQAVFNILDTPNGRILKTLCDYGCNIGVSSRGSGDLISGFDGNEAVDPDTYNCEGWDAVIIPAVKEARLQYVNESLDKTRYRKSLRTKLQESLDKASADDRKVMEEALDNIGIKLDEVLTTKQALKTFNADSTIGKLVPDAKYKDGQEVRVGDCFYDKSYDEYLTIAGVRDDSSIIVCDNYNRNKCKAPMDARILDRDRYSLKHRDGVVKNNRIYSGKDAYNTVNEDIVQNGNKYVCTMNGETQEFNSLENARKWQSMMEKHLTEEQIGREEVKQDKSPSSALNPEDEQVPVVIQTTPEDEELKESISSSTYVRQLPTKIQSNIKQDITDYLESEGYVGKELEEIVQNAMDGKLVDLSDDIDIHKYLTEGAISPKKDIHLEAKPFNYTISFKGNSSNIDSAVVVIPNGLKVGNDYIDAVVACEDCDGKVIDFASTDEAQDWIDSYGSTCLYRIDNGSELHAIPAECYDIANSAEFSELAAGDDGALVEQLQKIVKRNKTLEEDIDLIQEKLSVSYAKEIELKEEIDNYKKQLSKMSDKTKEIKALQEKLSQTQDCTIQSEMRHGDKISTLNESLSKKDKENSKLKEINSKLKESVDSKNTKISQLKEQLTKEQSKVKVRDNSISELKENYETAQKELIQLKEQHSNKVKSQNTIIEKYKKVANDSVKRYVESQAIRLGVKPVEIMNRLPKSYTFKDIDIICEDLQEYKFNMTNLPFSTSSLNENLKISAKNIGNQGLIENNPYDEITSYDLKIAEALMK